MTLPESMADSSETTPSPSAFAREWSQFTAGLGSLHALLERELAESWRHLRLILEEQQSTPAPTDDGMGTVLARFIRAREDAGRRVFQEPVARWERLGPLRRAILAMESYHRGLDDLIRRVPTRVTTSGPEVAAALAPPALAGVSGRLVGWRKAPRSVPLQALIADGLHRAEPRQLDVEDRCAMAFTRAGQLVRRHWDRVRDALDAGVREPGIRPIEGDPIRTLDELDREVAAALGDLGDWCRMVGGVVERRIAVALAWGRRPRAVPPDRTRHFEHWSAQLGSVDAEFRLEGAVDQLERGMLAQGERAAAALETERRGLLNGIDVFLGWLRAALAGEDQTPPRPVPEVVPALSRLTDLASGATSLVDAMPAEVRVLRRLAEEPVRKLPWRVLEPRRMAREAFDEAGRTGLERMFADAETVDVSLLQQIERARQVVEFGAGVERSPSDAPDESVAREALENARSLLEVERQTAPAELVSERERIARILAGLFHENRLLLSRSRLGVFAHLGRLGVRQAIVTGTAAVVVGVGQGLRLGWGGLGALYRRFLIAIEWMPEETGEATEVARRPYLPREFILDPREKDLPAIYRRLFRIEAVDDPRFLVGRDVEMRALAEARTLWEADRPVAILVVGERGSGKTSLINCALQRPLAGLDVVRGELNARVASPAGLRGFLAELLEVSDPARLEEEMNGTRRVLVLEEMERAFLREVGGFDGVRELQRIIAATCGNTLWVLVTNQQAFRLLDAAVRLGDVFSHRIDVAMTPPAAIRQAIMVRHNLSGFRLRFTPALADRSIGAVLRRRLKRTGNPEEIFFARLARESAGVFRTAFEIWLGQIEAVEAGTLVMKAISAPDIGAVIAGMDQDDLFALLAIMQHGSLTAEEHAAVFQWARAASRAELDDLLAREIIEPDPIRPGFRVRPGALRVVQEALHRRNLG
jgi:hypothetical protein